MLKDRIKNYHGKEVQEYLERYSQSRNSRRLSQYLRSLEIWMKAKQSEIDSIMQDYFPLLFNHTKTIVEIVERQNVKQIVLVGRDGTVLWPILKEMQKSGKFLQDVEINNIDFSNNLKDYLLENYGENPAICATYVKTVFDYFRVNTAKLDRTMFIDTGFKGRIIKFFEDFFLKPSGIKTKLPYLGLLLEHIDAKPKSIYGHNLYVVGNNVVALANGLENTPDDQQKSLGYLLEQYPKNRAKIDVADFRNDQKINRNFLSRMKDPIMLIDSLAYDELMHRFAQETKRLI